MSIDSKMRTHKVVCAAALVNATVTPSPFRFDRGRHVCAVEGGPCSCDGVVTFHSIRPTASGAVRMRLDDGPPPNSHSLAPRALACLRNLTFAPETLNAGPTPGVCICHRRDATKPVAPNLLFVNSVGPDASRLKNVEENVRRFARGTWECVVAVYATAAELPLERLEAIAEVCHVHRTPGRRWGSFLLALTPTMVQHFDKVAVLLDDVVLPRETPVESMLREMDAHGVDVYSPAIDGGSNRYFASSRNASKQRCLLATRGIEVFFSIYRREAWTCYYVRLLNAANEGGCGYDLCLHQACPHLNLAVDHRITAVHGGDCCKRKTGNPCRWQQYQAVCGKADIWIARAGPCITQRPFGFPSLVNQSGTNPPSFGSKIKLG